MVVLPVVMGTGAGVVALEEKPKSLHRVSLQTHTVLFIQSPNMQCCPTCQQFHVNSISSVSCLAICIRRL